MHILKLINILWILWKAALSLDALRSDSSISVSTMNLRYIVKAVYCHPAYLPYMQSTSWETLGWKKHKLESRLPGEISITSDMQDDTTLLAENEEELKSLIKVKEESEKAGLKLNIQKTKIMASGPITS